jgi:vacuolar iron transporter family protein
MTRGVLAGPFFLSTMKAMTNLSPALKKTLLQFQQSERTEALVYDRLANMAKLPHNREVLQKIANEERGHAKIWEQIAGKYVGPNKLRVWKWVTITRIFGLTFGARFMERGEEQAQKTYKKIIPQFPEAERIMKDEEQHEQALIELLNEKKLEYVGSVVLGLNDALVELSGALAGFSFAIQNTHVIALLGIITGVAASLSMAASEYLSSKEEGKENALTSSLYTGVAYISTVALLILPYLIFHSYVHALIAMLVVVLLVIAGFNFYISVAKNESFKTRFWEMALISFGVAAISFSIGVAVRLWLGLDM